ncbi:hypothetical protein F4808DRAFT_407123 [Astrocystis sublimbata]|nr:hypothetical protein F4808DRAFT_407123 [Astrocystis sublimbata]
MAHNWHDAPELAPQQQAPEVYYPAPTPENFASTTPISLHQFNKNTPTFIDTPKSSYAATVKPIESYHFQQTDGGPLQILPSRPPQKVEKSRWLCGDSRILFGLLSILTIAVIGLAVGTGVQANKARDAESRLAAYVNSRNNTNGTNSTNSTGSADTHPIIDLGCSANADSVTASRYTSDFYARQTYGIYCNSDAPNPPLQSLFVGTFGDCIDACASYSVYTPGNFPKISASANFTCSAVSFIPAWTNRTKAVNENAPGNCYLKPGPQNLTALTHPSADGTTVHAAVLQSP